MLRVVGLVKVESVSEFMKYSDLDLDARSAISELSDHITGTTGSQQGELALTNCQGLLPSSVFTLNRRRNLPEEAAVIPSCVV